MAASEDVVRAYYAAFNRRDLEGFLGLLDENVVHDINQGGREIGKAAFRAFLERMNRCYAEEIAGIVVMTDASGRHAAASFTVLGRYIATDDGLPPANGQSYRLPGAAIFELRSGKIARVANYYNLQDWLRQISPAAAAREAGAG